MLLNKQMIHSNKHHTAVRVTEKYVEREQKMKKTAYLFKHCLHEPSYPPTAYNWLCTTPTPTDDLRVDIGAIIVHTLVFGSNTSADSKPNLTKKKNKVVESKTMYKSNKFNKKYLWRRRNHQLQKLIHLRPQHLSKKLNHQ